MSEGGNLIEVELVKIVIRDTNDQQYIFLKEKEGERLLPIVIGYFEASAIDRRVRGESTPRPMTHKLLADTIEALGARLLRVVVTRLHENTFYASLELEQGETVVPMDCRPSDAIALAVRTEAPIYVAEEVIEAVAGL
jgi:bifunctional DNase/RNase